MLFVLSRSLVFFLLTVDWVEDTHFGNYLFSRPFASSDVSPLDIGFREGKGHEEQLKSLDTGLPNTQFVPLPIAAPSVSLELKRVKTDHSLDSMYVFMSLQL